MTCAEKKVLIQY